MLRSRYLEQKNKDEYDDRIFFEEEDHIYNVKSEYFGDKVLNKYNGELSLPLKSVTEFTGVFFNSFFDKNRAQKIWNDVKCRFRMEYDKSYTYYGVKSLEQLEFILSEGPRMGTQMHAYFEDLANLFEYRRDHPEDQGYMEYVEEHLKEYVEYKFFKKFIHEFGIVSGKRKFYRTEYKMFHPELNISGMIDGILYNEEKGGYEIIDYKRCQGGVRPYKLTKAFEDYSDKSKGMNTPSLKKLLNFSIIKYGIQLSLYRYMFQRMHPDKKIVGMYLIVVDSKKVKANKLHEAFQIIEIPLHKHDVNILEMFQYRAREIMQECGDRLPNELYEELKAIVPEMPPSIDKLDVDWKKDYYRNLMDDL